MTIISKTTTSRINSASIKKESFYNLCKISEFTRYASPERALAANHGSFEATKDAHGNVIRAWFVPACASTYLPIL